MSGQTSTDSGFGHGTGWQDVIAGRRLDGKLAIVTGGSAGLGKETALALGQAGADVVLGARSLEQLKETKAALEGAGVRQVHVERLDLSDQLSVAAFADAVRDRGRPVDLLIANAGIMACPLARDARGNEMQLSTNFLGHAVLVSELAPQIAAAGRARVISLSSTGHHYSPVDLGDLNFDSRRYEKWVAYGQSKTASSLLAVKVAGALGDRGVSAFAVHPGMIATDLSRFLEPADYEAARKQMGDLADALPAFKTVESGAATSIWAAVAPALADRRFAYCEDCDVAPLIPAPNYGWGVLPYAIDPELADGLWDQSERLLGRTLPLAA